MKSQLHTGSHGVEIRKFFRKIFGNEPHYIRFSIRLTQLSRLSTMLLTIAYRLQLFKSLENKYSRTKVPITQDQRYHSRENIINKRHSPRSNITYEKAVLCSCSYENNIVVGPFIMQINAHQIKHK